MGAKSCMHVSVGASPDPSLRLAVVAVTALLLVFPWVSPFAPGPTPNVVPLLISWTCACIVVCVLALSARAWSAGLWATVVATSWIVAGISSSAVALVQYFGLSHHFTPWIHVTALGEAFGNLRQRNQFASLCNIALASTLFVHLRLDKKSAVVHAAFHLIAWVLVCGNAASSSRIGLLQLLAVAVISMGFGWWTTRAGRALACSALAAYLCASWLLPALVGADPGLHASWARFGVDAGCHSRTVMWSNVLHLVSLRPWLGWGLGELGYAHFTTLYSGPRFCEILDNAHNLPLHLAVELGIPAAAGLCLVAVGCVLKASPWKDKEPRRQLAWMVLCMIGMHSLVEYPLWYGPFQMAVALSMSLFFMFDAAGHSSASGPAVRTTHLRWPLVGMVVVAMVGVAKVGLDYARMRQIYLPVAERLPAYRDDTLRKSSDILFFADQVRFARLSITPLDEASAADLHPVAVRLLHFSAEPLVIEKLMDSAALLGRAEEAEFYALRFKAAFPQDYERWREKRS